MLDLQVQKEILDEIAQKSDGKNPVKIDISDPTREMNFHTMRFDRCFSFFNPSHSRSHSSQLPVFVEFDQIQEKDIMTSLAQLTSHGHQHRFDINALLEKSRLQHESNEIMKKRIAIDEQNLTLKKIEAVENSSPLLSRFLLLALPSQVFALPFGEQLQLISNHCPNQ
jgi:hypothetical protein